MIFVGSRARGEKTSQGVWEVFGFSQSVGELNFFARRSDLTLFSMLERKKGLSRGKMLRSC